MPLLMLVTAITVGKGGSLWTWRPHFLSFTQRWPKAPSVTCTSLGGPLPTERVTLPAGLSSWLIICDRKQIFCPTLPPSFQLVSFPAAVTAAPTAPWPPAPTTLTTAAPVWRPRCLTWATTTTTRSMTRTMTKTNLTPLPFPSPTSTAFWTRVPVGVVLLPVCFSNTPLPVTLPVFLLGSLRGVDENWKNRGAFYTRCCCFHCSVCLTHFSISHPSWTPLYIILLLENVKCVNWIIILHLLWQTDIIISVPLRLLFLPYHGFWMAGGCFHGVHWWGSITCVDTFLFLCSGQWFQIVLFCLFVFDPHYSGLASFGSVGSCFPIFFLFYFARFFCFVFWSWGILYHRPVVIVCSVYKKGNSKLSSVMTQAPDR